MSGFKDARDGRHAVSQFAAQLDHGALDRIEARLDGRGGLARLCEVEAAIARAWAARPAKELVWLAGAPTEPDRLQLRAFGPHGELLGAARYRLADPCDA